MPTTIAEVQEEQKCHRCGSANAMQFGDEWYCRECYFICGSCCMEFGGDDYWKEIDEQERK